MSAASERARPLPRRIAGLAPRRRTVDFRSRGPTGIAAACEWWQNDGVTFFHAAALAALLTLGASVARAEDDEARPARKDRIDTEHLLGFMLGTDVGEVGDREMEAEVIGRDR